MKIVLIICAVIILFSQLKNGNGIKGILLSTFSGISSLYAANLIGKFIGIHLNINLLSLLISAIGSVPGVIFLLISDIILK